MITYIAKRVVLMIPTLLGVATLTATGIQAALTRIYGPGLNASFVERPELIGGMRIRVSSDIYDGSVQGKLAALAASF